MKEKPTPPPPDKTSDRFGSILKGAEQQAYLYWDSNKKVFADPEVVEYFKTEQKL